MDKKRITKTEIFKVIAAILGIVILVGVALKESNRNKIEAPDVEEAVITVTTTETTPVTTLVSTSAVTTTTTEITTTEETTTETTVNTEVTEIVTDAPVENVIPETEAPKAEEPVVDTEPIVEVQPVETEKQEEYLVYKESTHYIHKNTCRWNKGDAVRVDDVTGLEARLCSECNPQCEGYTEYVEPTPSTDNMTYVGYFNRVTYYPQTHYYPGVCGGSGRTLIGYGDYGDGIRGSIASRTLQETYGYNRNGRTTVYLEFPGYEFMNGYYYVDDACRYYGVIDVFVWSESSYDCPFYGAGVITANCYID